MPESQQYRATAGLAPSGLLLLAALTLVWGLNWPFMKISLSEVSVLWFRTSCVCVGGFTLLLLSLISGDRITIPLSQIPAVLLCASFGIVGWHLCTGYGLLHMPAGRAAIIAFLMPVIAAVLSTILLNERLSWSKILGLLLGMTGLAILIGPDLIVVQRAPIGAILMLGAAFSWAMGTVLFKRFQWRAPTSTVIGWQLMAGAVPISLAAYNLEPIPVLSTISLHVWGAMLFVFFIPMVFGQWAFYKIVKMLPASVAAISTLAIPIVGVYASALILGERVGMRELISLAIICSALAIVLIAPLRREPAEQT
ncbi:MAG: DMT family transporter [Hyphomicrobiaceae bacterium]